MTLTRTSPALGGSTVMDSSARGCLGPRATIAEHLMGFPAVAEKSVDDGMVEKVYSVCMIQ